MSNIIRIPHLIKYMGSKRELLGFIASSIEQADIESDWFCDLFAGTSVVGCSFKDRYNLQINDIQSYTSIFANTYLLNLKGKVKLSCINDIKERVEWLVDEFHREYPDLHFEYKKTDIFSVIKEKEKAQRELINYNFKTGFSLFVRYYSGTYWSFEQCVWIDSIRAVAESYNGRVEFYVIISSLIFAMSYASQGTGHFAQFREINESNLNDILTYRYKDIWSLFERKFIELVDVIDTTLLREYRISSLDYRDCLRIVEPNSIVYADPPYSSVHYSRFYHAIETLVRYDYPIVKYKGRYREDRHQSPFSKKTEVHDAFKALFEGVKSRGTHILLSYSNNGLIGYQDILNIGKTVLGNSYKSDVFKKEYTHSKMGRSDVHNIEVDELIISFKNKKGG